MIYIQKQYPDLDVPKTLNRIQKALQAELKPLGFTKHGRTHHRFVDGDISQVINFQCGQSIYDLDHEVVVNIGVRIPEIVLGEFHGDAELKKYYKEYECNVRSKIGLVGGQKIHVYDLSGDVDDIIEDLLRRVKNDVLPFFERFGSRDAILKELQEKPQSTLRPRNDEYLGDRNMAMIYGRRGEMERAYEAYNRYYRGVIKSSRLRHDVKKPIPPVWGERCIKEAERLGIPITEENMALAMNTANQ